MTIKILIELLKQCDQNSEIYLCRDYETAIPFLNFDKIEEVREVNAGDNPIYFIMPKEIKK